MIKKRDKTSDHLETIPGVGQSIAKDLQDIGVYKVPDLINKNPEELFETLCRKRCMNIDRCELYVFRCAVYYAENDEYDRELLKWWNWKDSKLQ